MKHDNINGWSIEWSLENWKNYKDTINPHDILPNLNISPNYDDRISKIIEQMKKQKEAEEKQKKNSVKSGSFILRNVTLVEFQSNIIDGSVEIEFNVKIDNIEYNGYIDISIEEFMKLKNLEKPKTLYFKGVIDSYFKTVNVGILEKLV